MWQRPDRGTSFRFRTAGRTTAALLLASIAGLATATEGHGQDVADKWGTESFEIAGFVGLLNDQPEFSPDFLIDQFRRDAIFGGRLGYTFGSNIFVQAEASNALVRVTFPEPAGPETRNTNVFFGGGSLGYNIQPRHDLQIFGTAGGGAVVWDAGLSSREIQMRLNYGLGFRYFVSPRIALRSDARVHHVPQGLEELRAETAGGAVNPSTFYGLEASLGISFFTQGSTDGDRDGVADRIDACAGTRAGVFVDSSGCPMDTDMDGVPNGVDQCSGTPRGAEVGLDGCPSDQDGDGRLDGLDQCPNTPSGARVDNAGCPLDRDGDGIFDGLDACPGTLSSADVDDRGCAADGDGDGVPDGIDACPRTPEGLAVSEVGCSELEAAIEAGRLVLHNVYFDFNRTSLRSDAQLALEEVGQVLATRPELIIEIQGHTDAIGAAWANLRLSQARAESVRGFLLEQFPILNGEQITAMGYGETRPIASNATAEGRQENRRVEFVVTGRNATTARGIPGSYRR